MDNQRQCSATKRNGERCKSRPLLDGDTCVLHSERGAQVRAKAVQASVAARREKVEDRKQASEDAKLTLTERLNRAAAARATELVDALVSRAIDGDMRAQGLVWDRVEGKVADHLITEAGDPFQMSEEQLARWLSEPAAVVAETPEPAPSGH